MKGTWLKRLEHSLDNDFACLASLGAAVVPDLSLTQGWTTCAKAISPTGFGCQCAPGARFRVDSPKGLEDDDSGLLVWVGEARREAHGLWV